MAAPAYDACILAFKAACIEDEMIYERAYEAVIWAMPMLNTIQVRMELLKHGAREGDLGYFGSRPTGRIEVPACNDAAPYIFGSASLRRGPMVIEVPAATFEAKFAGSVFNVWNSVIEDFGPSGVDGGKGGKFVLLPPGWKRKLPDAYTSLQCGSYEFQVLLRSIPARMGEQGWADAVRYARRLRLYPLADAASPRPAGWFDVSKVKDYFHGSPFLTFDAFRLIHEYVQNEPVQECDKAVHGMLSDIGIEKGKPFGPSAKTAKILDQAARDAETYLRGELENGRVFDRCWPDRAWGLLKVNADIVRTLATWNFPDRLDYHARALHFFYFAAAMPRRPGSGWPASCLFAATDSRGRPLDGAKSYHLHIPADAAARDCWSLVLYSTRTRSYLDTGKFGISSKAGLTINSDGSTDLYLAPQSPQGSESNWLETRAGERMLSVFRFHGPTEAGTGKRWKLGDFEEIR